MKRYVVYVINIQVYVINKTLLYYHITTLYDSSAYVFAAEIWLEL